MSQVRDEDSKRGDGASIQSHAFSRVGDERISLWDGYSNQMNGLHSALHNQPASVLYCMVVAVAHDTAFKGQMTPDEIEIQLKASEADEYIDWQQNKHLRVQLASSAGTFSSLFKLETALTSAIFSTAKLTNPIVVDALDDFSISAMAGQLIAACNSSNSASSLMLTENNGLRAFELHAIARLQMSRLLATHGLPLRHSMTAVERCINETELLTFSSLSSSDLYRSHQLQLFEGLIREQTKSLPNFTGAMNAGDGEDGSVLRRKYFRSLPARLLAQLLGKELLTQPLVLKKYYELSDELLLCLHWPPPSRRNRSDRWIASAKNDTDGVSFSQDVRTITPAGKAVAFLQAINDDVLNPWLSVHYPDCKAGVRLATVVNPLATRNAPPETACVFSLETEDQSRTLIFGGPRPSSMHKPDKCGTVCAMHRLSSGIAVTVCTTGDVLVESDYALMSQSTLSREAQAQDEAYALMSENSRFIGAEAAVVRTFPLQSPHPFAKEILRWDGSRELFLKDDYDPVRYQSYLENSTCFECYLLTMLPVDVRWISLSAEGACESCRMSDDGMEFVRHEEQIFDPSTNQPLQLMETLVDAETRSLTKYFRDGRVCTLHSNNGPVETLFPDRTRFVYHPQLNVVNISRGTGWPTIEIDCEVDSVCRSHCRGLEVPINKSGDRVRLRTSLSDGSAILVKYDTRVTAKTNGSLTMIYRNRASLIARDDESVVFTPSTAWTEELSRQFMKDSHIDDLSAPPAVRHTITPGHLMMMQTNDDGIPQTAHDELRLDSSSLASLSAKSTASKSRAQPSSTATKKAPSTATRVANTASVVGTLKKKNRQTSSKMTKIVSTIREEDKNINGHDLFTSRTEADVTLHVELLTGKVVMRDYEYNTFNIDLAFSRCRQQAGAVDEPDAESSSVDVQMVDPLQKPRETSLDIIVRLAGEVAGLKPPAVARFPKAPRLFIVNRHGDATEVMSVQDVSTFEHAVEHQPDTTRHDSPAIIGASELGPVQLIRYNTLKKFLTLKDDGFSFEDVFGPRNYLVTIASAAHLHVLHTKPNVNYIHKDDDLEGHEVIPRLFTCVSVLERAPLSQNGYGDILTAFQRCNEFREKRNQTLDRFAVEDPRTQEQLDEEEAIIKRLKQAYKLAKINAAKRKEHNKEREDRIAEGDDEDEESQAVSHAGSKAAATKGSKDTSPTKRARDINVMEMQIENDDEDGDDDEEPTFSDDEEKAEDPDLVVTKQAFEDYCSPSALVSWGGDVMSVNDLQEVFIRIFNRFVSPDEIDKAITHTDEVEVGLEELTLNEFRALFRTLKRYFNGEPMDQPQSQDDEFGLASIDDLDSDGSASVSRVGSPIPRAAPPLNLQRLQLPTTYSEGNPTPKTFESSSMTPSVEFKDIDGQATDAFAAGSAINLVRKVKSGSVSSKQD